MYDVFCFHLKMLQNALKLTDTLLSYEKTAIASLHEQTVQVKILPENSSLSAQLKVRTKLEEETKN